LPSIRPQDRLEIERLVSRGHLEADARARIPLENQLTEPENTDSEIGWRGIQRDQIDGSADAARQLVREIVWLPIERRGRRHVEQHADVDVAVSPIRASDRAPYRYTAAAPCGVA
jgi:hypothetical protein